jgi:metallo-beta-lactamase class B
MNPDFNFRAFLGQVFLFLILAFLPIAPALSQEKTADMLTLEEKLEMGKPYHAELAEYVEPFTVVANIHSVGAKDIGVYLITTPVGHILIDTGSREMFEPLMRNIDQLGYDVEDIEIILSTHAHFDHVQGHEAMRQASGAEVIALGLDAEALRQGLDLSPLGFEGWPPVELVTTLPDGKSVKVGEVELTAHLFPGHTPGCTVWTTTVQDEAEELDIAFFGCRGPNGFVKIRGNEDFPDLEEQTLLGFQRLKALSPDIYLNNHPMRQFEGKTEAMKEGVRPHPLLDQQPWDEMVEELELDFLARLED